MRDYAKIVSAAEAAVAKLADEKLKVIAFTEILKHQLHGSHGASDKVPSKVDGAERTAGRTKPERAEKQTTQKAGLPSWLMELRGDDFFKAPQSQRAIYDELVARCIRLGSRLDL